MEFIAQILDMVKEILAYVNEPEAAGIIDIIKGFFAKAAQPKGCVVFLLLTFLIHEFIIFLVY